MPTRAPDVRCNHYFLLPVEVQPSELLKSYIASFPKGSEWEIKHAWLLSHPEYRPCHVTPSEAAHLPKPSWGSGIVRLPEFFGHVAPIRAPVAVFKLASVCNLYGFYYIEVLWRDGDVESIQAALDCVKPHKWDTIDIRRTGRRLPLWVDCYLFGTRLWVLTETDKAVREEELRLLFLEAVDRDRTKFERLKRKFSAAAGAKIDNRRETIPEEVRIYVWRRDQGRCVRCGSQERLELDHIIPHSKGGSSTERNIQLLCEICNRKKGDVV